MANQRVFLVHYYNRDVSRVRHCVLGAIHSSFGRREYWMNGPIGCRKKLNVHANYKLRKKTASHDMQICVPWKQFLSTHWLFTVYFAVNFQTKAEKPLCFLIIFLSCQCLVCYVWIPTDVILSELFFGETIGHWSANNNLPFQSILSLLHAFQANFTL